MARSVALPAKLSAGKQTIEVRYAGRTAGDTFTVSPLALRDLDDVDQQAFDGNPLVALSGGVQGKGKVKVTIRGASGAYLDRTVPVDSTGWPWLSWKSDMVESRPEKLTATVVGDGGLRGPQPDHLVRRGPTRRRVTFSTECGRAAILAGIGGRRAPDGRTPAHERPPRRFLMFPQPQTGRPTVAMTFHQMLERVRYDGAHPTLERAEPAVRTVLAALGRQLTGDERVDLAACLPVEAALVFAAEIPATVPLTGDGFVRDLAARTDGTPATARWNTCTVLAVVARLAGAALVTRILEQLPDGYALLFGRTELAPAA